MDKSLPVPKLLKVPSLVATCPCGRWLGRWPEYLGMDEYNHECPNDDCTHTSVIIRQGRPYGPKSKQWANIVSEFNELWHVLLESDLEGVVTEPPFTTATIEAIDDRPVAGYAVECLKLFGYSVVDLNSNPGVSVRGPRFKCLSYDNEVVGYAWTENSAWRKVWEHWNPIG